MKTRFITLALGAFAFSLPALADTPPSQAALLRLIDSTSSAATPEQLAADYPALALLPAEAGEFITLNQLASLFRRAPDAVGEPPPELANATQPGHPAAGSVFVLRTEQLGDVVERVLGTTTISDGTFTLKLRIELPSSK